MIDLVYYMFYCATGDADTKSKHEMAVYGMELIFTQLFIFLSMIVMGACNIRFNNFILYIIILSPVPFISYYLINRYYIKSSRHIKILDMYLATAHRTKIFYKTIVIFLFIFSFILLIVGGMIMSYLLGLYE